MLASRIFGCANGPRYRGAEASQSWYSGNHGDGCIMVNCDPICLDVNKKVVWKVEVGLHTVPYRELEARLLGGKVLPDRVFCNNPTYST